MQKRKNITNTESNNKNFNHRDILNELEIKFPNYDFGELAFDECFGFICKNSNSKEEAIIISSILRQIEPTINEIKIVYNLDDQHIDNLTQNKLSELRVLAYNKLKMDLIYTDFNLKDPYVNSAQAQEIYSVYYLPNIDKKKIKEYDANLYTEEQLIDLIIKRYKK